MTLSSLPSDPRTKLDMMLWVSVPTRASPDREPSLSFFRRPSVSLRRLIAFAVLALTPAVAYSQHEHHAPAPAEPVDHSLHGMIAGPLGISHARMGSGPAWLPDAPPMRGGHSMWGRWSASL